MSTEQTKPTRQSAPPVPAAGDSESVNLREVLSGIRRRTLDNKNLLLTLAVVLIVVFAIYSVSNYFNSRSRTQLSRSWLEFSVIGDPQTLQEWMRENQTNTKSAAIQAGNLQLARLLMGPLGLDRLSAPDPNVRSEALKSVELAREVYKDLANKFKQEPLIQAEALMAQARAEEALIGIPHPERVLEDLGSVVRAKAIYELLANEYKDTPQGKDAAKRLEILNQPGGTERVERFYREINRALASRVTLPLDKDLTRPGAILPPALQEVLPGESKAKKK
jgi:hypothetical protein